MDSIENIINAGKNDSDYTFPDMESIPSRYREMNHIVDYVRRIRGASGNDGDSVAFRIGSRIRTIRRAQGLSQGVLGQKIGLTADRVQKYENGVRKPKAELLDDFAVALGANSMALVDPIVSDPIGAMFALFEMELLYDLKIGRQDDKLILSFPEDLQGELKEYLNEWERVYSAYIEEYEHASSPAEARLLTESYNKWKYSFPPTQSEAESKLSRKQILEQQLQLLDEQREILQRKIEELENETED